MALEKTGVELIAEGAQEFERSLEAASGAMSEFDSAGQQTSDSFNGFEEIITGALRRVGEIALDMALNAGQALIDFGKASFEGALDAEKGLTKLRGAIQRAGEQAPITEQKALELAQSLKGLAGGSDDAVIAAQAVLLKFQSIGEDTFPQALQTSLDLAAILGTDVTNAAEMLGRALGNPEQASRLLRQAGVFLTDQEKELVKGFIESGDAASAQQFILEKLAATTAGAAEQMAGTVGGQMAIFKETIADAGEQVATAFLPILQELFDNVIKPALPIIEKFAALLASQVGPAFEILVAQGNALLPIFQPIIDALQNLGATFTESFPEMQQVGQDFTDWIQTALGATMPQVIQNIADIINSLSDIWREHGDTIMAVVSIVAKILVAVLGGAFLILSGIVSAALKFISGVWETWSKIFQGDWEGAWETMLETLRGVWGTIVDTLSSFVRLASSIVTDGMRDAFSNMAMNATAPIQDLVIAVGRAIMNGWGIVYEAGVSLMDGLRNGIWAGIGWITDAIAWVISAAIDNVKSMFGMGSPATKVSPEVGVSLAEGMANGILSAIGNVRDALGTVTMGALDSVAHPLSGGGVSNVSNSVSNSRAYNLNINSAQESQGLASDFAIIQAMA